MFCAGYNHYFFRYAFPLNSDDFSAKAFFLQLHFMLIFAAVLRLILSFNFPWYLPEKSGNICLFFRHVLFNIQWILFVLTFFHWTIFLSYPFYSLIYSFIHSLFISLFIRIFLYLAFSFVHSFLTHFVLSFWAV